MTRTLVLGDVHGAYKALVQVMERCNFNKETDRIIFLGDVADGYSQTWECVDWLYRNAYVWVAGNHDVWTYYWMSKGVPPFGWVEQGGQATLQSYAKNSVTDDQLAYFRKAVNYHIETINGQRCVFTHGGFDPRRPLKDQSDETFQWDRDLWYDAVARESGWKLRNDETNPKNITEFDRVFIGHTAMPSGPRTMCEVTNMDTGAGWHGKLSVYCIETDETWQSNTTKELYPDEMGRG